MRLSVYVSRNKKASEQLVKLDSGTGSKAFIGCWCTRVMLHHNRLYYGYLFLLQHVTVQFDHIILYNIGIVNSIVVYMISLSPKGQQPIIKFYLQIQNQNKRPVDSYKPAKRSLSHNGNDYNPRD